jgi:prophage maintenance system killer protein
LKNNTELVIYQSENGAVSLDVEIIDESVWLTQAQMTELFDRDRTVITRHINNVFSDNELPKESNVHFLHIAGSDRPVAFYSLDVIISVGYRVKSQNGTQFRIWANKILKQYIMKGYALNNDRLVQLGMAVQVMKRSADLLDSHQVLDVIEAFSKALNLLDHYDHGTIGKPIGTQSTYTLEYGECKKVIEGMRFSAESNLFGMEKDESFQSSIAAIYQTYNGTEMYPSLEEKAANLLYFITKNHSFVDGNKRIAAAIFLYFLNKNQALFHDGKKCIDDHSLVALVILIAESNPDEKEIMIRLVMNFLNS